MDDLLTIAQIEERFASEWVLVEDPQVNDVLEVQSGKIRWHSKDREEVYRQAVTLRALNGSLFFCTRGGCPKARRSSYEFPLRFTTGIDHCDRTAEIRLKPCGT